MLRKNRLVWLALAIVAVTITVVSVWPRSTETDSITMGNYDRIEKDMTLNQVDEILGRPRTYGMFPCDLCNWVGNKSMILVWFDGNGRVTAKKFVSNPPTANKFQIMMNRLGF